MKKYLLFPVFLVILISFVPVGGETWEGYEYIVRDDSAVIVSYSGSSHELMIPLAFNGLEVKGIAEGAFEGNEKIERVTMPSSIEFIDDRAFSGCKYLTVVNISSGLKRIGDEAFRDCASLSYFTLPGPLESIGRRAFAGCANISYIHDITDGYLTTVGSGAFDDTLWFENFRGDFVTICQGCLLLKYRGNEAEPSMPWDIVSIAEDAFDGNDRVETLILPNYLTALQSGAISNMDSLTAVKGGSGLVYAAEHAFRNLPKLSSVDLGKVDLTAENFLDCPLSPYGSESGAPYDASVPDESDARFISAYDEAAGGVVITFCRKEAVDQDGVLVIPERIRGKKVVAIGTGACQDRSDIRKLLLPEYLKEIRSWAFAYDYELSEAEFPGGLEKIGADAFNSCEITRHVPELPEVDVDPRAFYSPEK